MVAYYNSSILVCHIYFSTNSCLKGLFQQILRLHCWSCPMTWIQERLWSLEIWGPYIVVRNYSAVCSFIVSILGPCHPDNGTPWVLILLVIRIGQCMSVGSLMSTCIVYWWTFWYFCISYCWSVMVTQVWWT